MHKQNIHNVSMFGGSSRIPKLADLMKKRFDGRPPRVGEFPEEDAAYGAAIRGAQAQQEDRFSVVSHLLHDQTSFLAACAQTRPLTKHITYLSGGSKNHRVWECAASQLRQVLQGNNLCPLWEKPGWLRATLCQPSIPHNAGLPCPLVENLHH